MDQLSGKWFIDGIDLWTTYSMVLNDGSADFLKYPPKKASTEHDWEDSHGVDVDLSRIFFGKREGVLRFAIMAQSEDDFWNKHDAFITMVTQPGLRRLELASHNNRHYYIYYQETSNYEQIAPLKGLPDSYKIAHRFSIVVVEPEPKVNKNTYLVDHDGSFLIA